MVVWDTGSDMLLLESSECGNCYGDVFEIEDSDTFVWDSGSYTQQYMDGTSLTGDWATDDACVTESDAGSCGTGYKFAALTRQSGLGENEDGILGMWSGNSSDADQDVMFMNYLAASGDITEKTFSFYMTGLDG